MKKLLAALALAPLAALAQGLEPGQWEFTTTMTMEGMPKPQSATVQRCITKADAQNPESWAGRGDARQSECKVDITEKGASRLRWEIRCPKQNMTGTGTARMGKGSMESDQVMKGTLNGRAFEMRMKTAGKRLGACKS
jgi:hypothetical protein